MNEINLKTRREFLRSTVLGGAVTWTVPSFLAQTFSSLHAEAQEKTQPTTGKDGTILVVLQLAGGNDGLNTVIPYSNDYYQKARPTLGIKSNLLKLDDHFALHPSLQGLKEIYDQGELSVIHGIGYPNPNRSHFRSTEIWQTASDANKFEKYGWLGRYFDNACKGADPTVGVCIGRQMPQAFSGPRPVGVSLENPESYRLASSDSPEQGENGSSMDYIRKVNSHSEMEPETNSGASIGSVAGTVSSKLSPLDYLERTALDAQVSSDKILSISRKSSNQGSYPAGQLANSLKLVARLIGGGLATRVYYVSQGGYDTHTNQAGTQERLLRDLGTSLKAFHSDLKAQGNFERVMVMTFSEFGRRLAQNANGGTDHGGAAPLFVIGPKVKAGLVGNFPSLAPGDLLNGDPKYTMDFRRVYAGVLQGWLKTNPDPVLARHFEPLILA
jgi:uncharacterized protein (DUF1501 family)